jgi:hypothetical protein
MLTDALIYIGLLALIAVVYRHYRDDVLFVWQWLKGTHDAD